MSRPKVLEREMIERDSQPVEKSLIPIFRVVILNEWRDPPKFPCDTK
jgi:hypothetical protein